MSGSLQITPQTGLNYWSWSSTKNPIDVYREKILARCIEVEFNEKCIWKPLLLSQKFRYVLTWVQERSSDLLNRSEIDFIESFSTLSTESKTIFVQMIMRKAISFLRIKLHYVEIGNPDMNTLTFMQAYKRWCRHQAGNSKQFRRGFVFLIDDRFLRRDVHQLLPRWWNIKLQSLNVWDGQLAQRSNSLSKNGILGWSPAM